MSNPFVELAEEVGSRYAKIADRVKRKLSGKEKEKDLYLAELREAAKDCHSLMLDVRYPSMQKFLTGTRDRLNEQLQLILTSDFGNYTRESRADRAAVVAAEIHVLNNIIEYPERIIDELKERGAQ